MSVIRSLGVSAPLILLSRFASHSISSLQTLHLESYRTFSSSGNKRSLADWESDDDDIQSRRCRCIGWNGGAPAWIENGNPRARRLVATHKQRAEESALDDFEFIFKVGLDFED